MDAHYGKLDRDDDAVASKRSRDRVLAMVHTAPLKKTRLDHGEDARDGDLGDNFRRVLRQRWRTTTC